MRERESERKRTERVSERANIHTHTHTHTSLPVADFMSRNRSTSSLISFAAFAFEKIPIISLVCTTSLASSA